MTEKGARVTEKGGGNDGSEGRVGVMERGMVLLTARYPRRGAGMTDLWARVWRIYGAGVADLWVRV